jgi:hypothetical protein
MGGLGAEMGSGVLCRKAHCGTAFRPCRQARPKVSWDLGKGVRTLFPDTFPKKCTRTCAD